MNNREIFLDTLPAIRMRAFTHPQRSSMVEHRIAAYTTYRFHLLSVQIFLQVFVVHKFDESERAQRQFFLEHRSWTGGGTPRQTILFGPCQAHVKEIGLLLRHRKWYVVEQPDFLVRVQRMRITSSSQLLCSSSNLRWGCEFQGFSHL